MTIKPIKLSPKRGNYGHVTSYTVNIGSAEARECGFTEENVHLEKIIDTENKQIVIRIKAE
ncbi:MAG: hypothetical protein ACI4JX_06520 [Oscillospiraceae bacterium]